MLNTNLTFNKYYETDAEAEADIANIPDGAIVYTNDGEDEPINARQIAYDDGTQSGSDVETQIKKKALVNTYYDSSVSKLYQVNADGTKGSEIPLGYVIKSVTPDSNCFTLNLSSGIPKSIKYLMTMGGGSSGICCSFGIIYFDNNRMRSDTKVAHLDDKLYSGTPTFANNVLTVPLLTKAFNGYSYNIEIQY